MRSSIPRAYICLAPPGLWAKARLDLLPRSNQTGRPGMAKIVCHYDKSDPKIVEQVRKNEMEINWHDTFKAPHRKGSLVQDERGRR